MTIEQITDGFTGIIVFTTSRCWPCKVLKPIIANLSEKHNMSTIMLDAESDPIAQKLNITRVPTTFLYNDGKKVFEFSWALPEEEIENMLSHESII